MRPILRLLPSLSVLIGLSTLTATCGGVASPSENRVETFSATLAVGGQNNHPFTVDKSGELSARITDLSPTPAVIIGTALFQSLGGTCNSLYTRDDFTGLNRDVLQLPINKGSYCVAVYDPGRLMQAQNYTIRISHP